MSAAEMTPTALAIVLVRRMRGTQGRSLDDAARFVCANYPRLVSDVMDRIGSHPSSEPELAAIQRAWSL